MKTEYYPTILGNSPEAVLKSLVDKAWLDLESKFGHQDDDFCNIFQRIFARIFDGEAKVAISWDTYEGPCTLSINGERSFRMNADVNAKKIGKVHNIEPLNYIEQRCLDWFLKEQALLSKIPHMEFKPSTN